MSEFICKAFHDGRCNGCITMRHSKPHEYSNHCRADTCYHEGESIDNCSCIPYDPPNPTEITHNGKAYRRVGDDEVIKEGDVYISRHGEMLLSVDLSKGLTGKQARKKWLFLEFYTPKEEPMKTKSLKPITLEAIVKAGAEVKCLDFQNFALKAFADGYSWCSEVPLEKALEWKRTDFLMEKGFYREEEDGWLESVSIADATRCHGYNLFFDAKGYGTMLFGTLSEDGLSLWRLPHPHNFPTDDQGRIKIVD